MNFTDEKDYIMRMIKEMVRVLFSLYKRRSAFWFQTITYEVGI